MKKCFLTMKNVKNGWSEFLKLEGSGLVEILFLS